MYLSVICGTAGRRGWPVPTSVAHLVADCPPDCDGRAHKRTIMSSGCSLLYRLRVWQSKNNPRKERRTLEEGPKLSIPAFSGIFSPSFDRPMIFLTWVWMYLNFPLRIKLQIKIQNADLPLAIFSSLFVAAAICWSVHQGGLWSENPPAHLADLGHVLIHIISFQLTMAMDTCAPDCHFLHEPGSQII